MYSQFPAEIQIFRHVLDHILGDQVWEFLLAELDQIRAIAAQTHVDRFGRKLCVSRANHFHLAPIDLLHQQICQILIHGFLVVPGQVLDNIAGDLQFRQTISLTKFFRRFRQGVRRPHQ